MAPRPRPKSPRGERVDRLARAREFLYRNARLLERLRFSYLFEGGSAEAVLHALSGYENPDGGFGNGLEPDLRGPLSQPVPVWTAVWVLDEVGRLNDRTAEGIVRFLHDASTRQGGVPFVFRSASDYPHAPWWEVGRGPTPAALNPTAGIAAAFYKARLRSDWLDRAGAWCWERIDDLRTVNPYELRVVLSFLDHCPDRARARTALERLRPQILSPKVVALNPRSRGDVFRPLDFAPEPGLLSRELFSPEAIEEHLDALENRQRSDGGWTVSFPIWTPITRFEWRGVQTVESLKVLRTNGRLGARSAEPR